MLMLLTISHFSSSLADSSPNLYVDPQFTSVDIGESFSINISIADVTDLSGWEFKLYYQNDILAIAGANEGPFLKQGGTTSFFIVDLNNNYNATHGRVWLTCVLLGAVVGVTGNGALATVDFQGIGAGNSTLHLTDSVLGDSEANAISHTTDDGEVQIIGLSDIAVTNVTPSKTIVGQSYLMKINVTLENQGDNTTTFNVTTYANTTIINTLTNIALTAGNSITVTFLWDNTTDFAKGNYTISAYAWPVPGEGDTTDNTLVDGWVFVTIPGDVDGDRDVDIYDVVKITGIYAFKAGDPGFNSNSDLDEDGEIKIYDVVMCTSHYGQVDP